jgi:hypothetical protein
LIALIIDAHRHAGMSRHARAPIEIKTRQSRFTRPAEAVLPHARP